MAQSLTDSPCSYFESKILIFSTYTDTIGANCNLKISHNSLNVFLPGVSGKHKLLSILNTLPETAVKRIAAFLY